MATIKTAISIDEKLFKKAEKLSHKLSLSRSQIFSQALEYLVKRNENLELLQKINEAYREPLDESEKLQLKKAKAKFSKLVKGSW